MITLLVFSSFVLALNTRNKTELVCSGEVAGYGAEPFNIEVTGSIVIIDFAKNTVNITGPLNGNYSITEITNESVIFAGSRLNQFDLVGSINRYTGKVIVNNDFIKDRKLTYSLELNCTKANRLF